MRLSENVNSQPSGRTPHAQSGAREQKHEDHRTEALRSDTIRNPQQKHGQPHLDITISGVHSTDLNPQMLLTDGLAPARDHWEVSSLWGTQSYGAAGKACAMCAEHIA